jgi:hypothetical protein
MVLLSLQGLLLTLQLVTLRYVIGIERRLTRVEVIQELGLDGFSFIRKDAEGKTAACSAQR